MLKTRQSSAIVGLEVLVDVTAPIARADLDPDFRHILRQRLRVSHQNFFLGGKAAGGAGSWAKLGVGGEPLSVRFNPDQTRAILLSRLQ